MIQAGSDSEVNRRIGQKPMQVVGGPGRVRTVDLFHAMEAPGAEAARLSGSHLENIGKLDRASESLVSRDPGSESDLVVSRRPVAIDLYCGLGGWTEALLAEGWDVYGFDVERHQYKNWKHDGIQQYPGQLILQDVCTIHGAQFAHADLIVASPPCQEFSYRAMPWKRAKALPPPYLGINLFWRCWRIQHEACEAAGRYIPMVVENVKGAQKWIGRAAWHYGSFYLWGDVPALMPSSKALKSNPDGTNHGVGSWFAIADSKNRGASIKNNGGSWFAIGSPGQKNVGQNPDGRKQQGSGAEWFDRGLCKNGSKTSARKAASAQIAKIPQPLAQHIARVYFPEAFARTEPRPAVRAAEKSANQSGSANLSGVARQEAAV